MVFGGIAHERIQFNEQTVWTGEPHHYAHKGAYLSLEKIRELLFAGKQKEAEDLAMREFMSVPLHQNGLPGLRRPALNFPDIREPEIPVTAAIARSILPSRRPSSPLRA